MRIIENAWSQGGQLRVQVPGSGVSMQQDFPEPGNYTVQFGFGPPPGAGVAAIRRPYALLSWTVKGTTVFREITPASGTSISGQAESVSVQLYDDIVAGMGGVQGGVYDAIINCSRGLRATGGCQAPTFYPRQWFLTGGGGTIQSGTELTLAAGIVAQTAIPLGATQVQVSAWNGAILTPADIRVFAGNSFGIQASWFPEPPGYFQLPALSDTLNISNLSAGNIFVNAIFGIDG